MALGKVLRTGVAIAATAMVALPATFSVPLSSYAESAPAYQSMSAMRAQEMKKVETITDNCSEYSETSIIDASIQRTDKNWGNAELGDPEKRRSWLKIEQMRTQSGRQRLALTAGESGRESSAESLNNEVVDNSTKMNPCVVVRGTEKGTYQRQLVFKTFSIDNDPWAQSVKNAGQSVDVFMKNSPTTSSDALPWVSGTVRSQKPQEFKNNVTTDAGALAKKNNVLMKAPMFIDELNNTVTIHFPKPGDYAVHWSAQMNRGGGVILDSSEQIQVFHVVAHDADKVKPGNGEDGEDNGEGESETHPDKDPDNGEEPGKDPDKEPGSNENTNPEPGKNPDSGSDSDDHGSDNGNTDHKKPGNGADDVTKPVTPAVPDTGSKPDSGHRPKPGGAHKPGSGQKPGTDNNSKPGKKPGSDTDSQTGNTGNSGTNPKPGTEQKPGSGNHGKPGTKPGNSDHSSSNRYPATPHPENTGSGTNNSGSSGNKGYPTQIYPNGLPNRHQTTGGNLGNRGGQQSFDYLSYLGGHHPNYQGQYGTNRGSLNGVTNGSDTSNLPDSAQDSSSGSNDDSPGGSLGSSDASNNPGTQQGSNYPALDPEKQHHVASPQQVTKQWAHIASTSILAGGAVAVLIALLISGIMLIRKP